MSSQNIVKQNQFTKEEEKSILFLGLLKDSKTGNKLSVSDAVSEIKKYIKQGFNINYRFISQKNWTLLNMVTYFGHVSLAKELVKLGADINLSTQGEVSNLHIAAMKNLDNLCHTYIIGGTDVNIKTIKGKTPIIYSCEAGAQEATIKLLDFKADIEIKDLDNKTCLDYANDYGDKVSNRVLSSMIMERVLYKNMSEPTKKQAVLKF